MSDSKTSPSVNPEVKSNMDCPNSPFPVHWAKIEFPSKDYFKKLSKDQIEQIDSERTKALNTANEKLEEANGQADDVYQAANAEFIAAGKKQIRDKHLLDLKTINKKTEVFESFKKALRENLPKNSGPPGINDTDILVDARVPRDKFAICVANFNKALIDEEINYLNSLKTINDLKTDADSKWKKAQETHAASYCSAKVVKEQAEKAAEIVWRTQISDDLQKLWNQ